MIRRLVLAALAATIVVAFSASAAFAGEITGNGRKLLTLEDSKWGTGLHARSLCAYSGQEDLQWFQDEGTDQIPVENPVKGVPGHAQSWGQIPKAVRDSFPVEMHPGHSCNPQRSSGE
ncbi:MAG TPA: hypothetical protein VJY85_06820 [Candidatus Limnocylindria bacterium]|nr:hypothetical protein [Candidatus Limnocylindria bacterium]